MFRLNESTTFRSATTKKKNKGFSPFASRGGRRGVRGGRERSMVRALGSVPTRAERRASP